MPALGSRAFKDPVFSCGWDHVTVLLKKWLTVPAGGLAQFDARIDGCPTKQMRGHRLRDRQLIGIQIVGD